MTQKKQTLAIVLLFGLLFSLCAAEPVYHIVKKGETLYSIARAYSISVEALMSANKITDAKTVKAGTRLVIPSAVSAVPPSAPAGQIEYIVKKGDTLYSISRQFSTSVEILDKLNSIGSSPIKPGQKLKVPGTADSVKPPVIATPQPAEKIPPVASTPDTVPVPVRPAAGASANQWPCAGDLSYLQGKLSGVSIKAKEGATLVAVRAGMVISAGPFLTWNNVVFVQAGDGLIYVYGGFSSMRVKAGEAVRRGTELGNLPSEKAPTAYFFVFKGSGTIDPANAPRD